MVCKKIKKSSSTVWGIVSVILIGIGLFFVLFSYMKTQTDQAGITIPVKYNDTFTRLESSQNNLSVTVNTIQDAIQNIKEADNAYQVAVNGFKVLGNTLKLSINFLGTAIDTTSAILIPLDFIPQQIKVLIFIGITAIVILIVLASLKGDPKMI